MKHTAAQQVAEPSYTAIHMEHCFQPPYETSCKYGDSDCPAQQAQPEPLITVESSLRFRLKCEQEKSAELLDEVRELKGKLMQAQGQEPVAEVESIDTSDAEGEASAWVSLYNKIDVGTKLYAAPIPQQPSEPAKVYTTCGNCDGLGKVLIYGIEESWEETCPKCNGGPAAPQPKDTK